METTLPNRASVEQTMPTNHLPNVNEFPVPEPDGEPVRVVGKFLYRGTEKFYLRGVTYGTFKPNSSGELLPEPTEVSGDFSAMVENGINTVRVYTVPPRWFLDLALQHKLLVFVGIPWDQHLAFLDKKSVCDTIEQTCRNAALACKGHPAVLALSLGNEIKGNVIRWLGRKRVETFLAHLCKTIKRVDSEALVTYVNFPTTEYLQLDFLDFISFNVYLEKRSDLESYLARLHSNAGSKPLVMAEIGLDSIRNGELTQARLFSWQIESVFECGCAGVFVYAWTDEWHTNGQSIEDWDFGLTTRDRQPKPALSTVKKAFSNTPFGNTESWPSMSVVVCSYNGSSTIAETITAIQALNYPNYDLVVIDDGSTDNTAAIAHELGAKVISTDNRGLSSARNTGYESTTGDIVVYCDDDAYPEQDWLYFLAIQYRSESIGAAGGPNLAPGDDGFIAECVAHSPGGPNEVLLNDNRAEHIPGCNLSIRRTVLEKLGGFDVQFRAAGDDVDMCWRILDAGYEIGFHAGAVNWHHRRNQIKTYLSQQAGYGKAEALLARKWPSKYNAMGHIEWLGVIYGRGITQTPGLIRHRIYSGVWGTAPFQRLYQNSTTGFVNPLLVPETLLLLALLAPIMLFAVVTSQLQLLQLGYFSLLALLVIQAGFNGYLSVANQTYSGSVRSLSFWKKAGVTGLLHLIQPMYRLKGRLQSGLTPVFKLTQLRSSRAEEIKRPMFKHTNEFWDGQNKPPEQRLHSLFHRLQQSGLNVSNEDEYSDWDMKLVVIPFGCAKLKVMVEEYGESLEKLKYRFQPRFTRMGMITLLASLSLGIYGLTFYDATKAGASLAFSLVILAWTYAASLLAMREMESALVIDGINPTATNPDSHKG